MKLLQDLSLKFKKALNASPTIEDVNVFTCAARDSNMPVLHQYYDTFGERILNSLNGWGQTAAYMATYNHHEEALTFLVEKGADLDILCKSSIVLRSECAFHCASVALIPLMIKGGADLDAQDSEQKTRLYRAAAKNEAHAIQVLITAGAKVDALAGAEQWTPLCIAARYGQLKSVEVLLDCQANPNFQTEDGGWTPLMLAVANKHNACAEALLKGGAKVSMMKHQGETVMHMVQNPAMEGMLAAFLFKEMEEEKEAKKRDVAVLREGTPSALVVEKRLILQAPRRQIP